MEFLLHFYFTSKYFFHQEKRNKQRSTGITCSCCSLTWIHQLQTGIVSKKVLHLKNHQPAKLFQIKAKK